MGKKSKSKARLDKFYYLAKDMGFRSRAAFKLLQINQKYHILDNARVVIDLCAAPGSWMQVCQKSMSTDSIILGFDLDKIRPIHNTRGYQCDITTNKCIDIIRREIKHLQVDAVLNDGAPNVGSDWSKDAYNQSELVLAACKLACKVLKKNGAFVTKGKKSNPSFQINRLQCPGLGFRKIVFKS